MIERDAIFTYSKRMWRIREIHGFAVPVVVLEPRAIQAFPKQPRAEEDLHKIVKDQDIVQLIRLPMFHVFGAP